MDCVNFLQLVLPQLQLRWAGFRKVRKQVCKRLKRRCSELGFTGFQSYFDYLQNHRQEWELLESFCRITISRFYRDRDVFDNIAKEVLPRCISLAPKDRSVIKIWSVGCASGEEPYTLALIWQQQLQSRFSQISLRITATDADRHLIERAKRGCYSLGSLRELPQIWINQCFTSHEGLYCLKQSYRQSVVFLLQDIRKCWPAGPFQLITCRNLVATYFDLPLQMQVFAEIMKRLAPGGYLILGKHEQLPKDYEGLTPLSSHLRIYQLT